MGIIFKHFLGTPSYGIIIYYGILTLIYTAYGGLYISIITDTFQGIASVVCAVIVFWYVVAKFRFPLAKPMPIDMGLGFKALYDEKARYGLSSICAMTLSLFCATVFSEAYWQRCWASESKKTLYMGEFCCYYSLSLFLGCLLVFFMLLLFLVRGENGRKGEGQGRVGKPFPLPFPPPPLVALPFLSLLIPPALHCNRSRDNNNIIVLLPPFPPHPHPQK